MFVIKEVKEYLPNGSMIVATEDGDRIIPTKSVVLDELGNPSFKNT